MSRAEQAGRSDLVDSPRTRLERVFDPHSIVVVGASRDPAKRGFQVLRSLVHSPYPYPIFAVNPRGGSVLGHRLLTGLAELPPGVDLALIATPARSVPAILSECAQSGIAGAVVLANGFGESGALGARLERQLRRVVADTGIRVVGPNTSGILSSGSGADLVGVGAVPAGPISVVTQSGNMLLSLLAENRQHHGPGFDSYIGLGNQADVSYADCLDYLSSRDRTEVIALHCEGFTDGRRLLQSAADASRRLPVVMLRGGRSVVGQRAALSHTGSVAAPDAVATSVLRQAGVELVERSDELAVVSAALATTPSVRSGGGIAVLSDGGGHATLAADALSAAGVELASLSDETRAALREVLGPVAAIGNPIDVAGATDTNPERFASCARTLAADPAVGLVLIVGLIGGYHLRFDEALRETEERTATQLVDIVRSHRMPIVVHSCYATENLASHSILRQGGINVLASLDHAVRAVVALTRRGQFVATAEQRSALSSRPASKAVPIGMLAEPDARRLLQTLGLSTGEWQLTRTAGEAAAAVTAFGTPCAMKVVSPDLVHKSDVGGVRLNVTPEGAIDAYLEVTRTIAAAQPEAKISGILVSPMAEPGVELLAGAHKDPVFGPIVAFGTGGVLVEALGDVSFRAAPLTVLEAKEMIMETAAARMLDGHRGLPPVDVNCLAEFLVRVGDIVASSPTILELDLNPVIVRNDRITPVDVRLITAGATPDTTTSSIRRPA